MLLGHVFGHELLGSVPKKEQICWTVQSSLALPNVRPNHGSTSDALVQYVKLSGSLGLAMSIAMPSDTKHKRLV